MAENSEKEIQSAHKVGKVVLTTGVFDILHTGHLALLKEAKALAGKRGRLIVLVARDSTVEKREGRRPIMPEDDRLSLIEALKPVDEARLGYSEGISILRVLKEVKPDIIVFGYDQGDLEAETRRIIAQEGLSIEVVKAKRYGSGSFDSSTKIKERIVETWKKKRKGWG
ncbi:MAG: adenylyltransferase/cytidyltransferase family protein [Candidatus Bathyarchaeia archaeon]